MEIRFDGKRALVTGAGKGKILSYFVQYVFYPSLLNITVFHATYSVLSNVYTDFTGGVFRF